MIKIELIPPIKDVYVTQGFGFNYVDFYEKMGLKGHPGIDFKARHGCPIKAAHSGEVTWARRGKDRGIGIEIWDKENLFKTFYYHHHKNLVKKGDKVKKGQHIAIADNTGKYTTGSHEHFELYRVNSKGQTMNIGNGFRGSIDPAPYFPEFWDRTPAINRYGRDKSWLAEWKMRFKNVWLHKKLNNQGLINKIFNDTFINALVYGGWGYEDVINDALWEQWTYLKKDEFTRKIIPFNR